MSLPLRRFVPAILVSAGAVGLALAHASEARAKGVAHATASASPPRWTRIDPAVAQRFDARARGLTWSSAIARGHTLHRADASMETSVEMAAVVLRFDPPPTEARRGELAQRGIFVADHPSLSGAWMGRVTERGQAALADAVDVVRVTLDEASAVPRPEPRASDVAIEETNAALAERARRAVDGVTLDGTGVVVADIDAAAHVFHPSLFHADGGYAAFVDVDGDGVLTPGVDGIDTDGDGTISAPETLRRLDAAILGATGKVSVDDDFDPRFDYLYLDVDGNGKRDYGRSFGEDTPAYGEPIFVADDVDGDGIIASVEKLRRLGTSKIRASKTQALAPYVRGKSSRGISQYEITTDDPVMFRNLGGHATLAMGVTAGGHAGQTIRGIAPAAELVHANPGSNIAETLAWTLEQKPDVLLLEVAPYVDVSLDGSSETEALLDAATNAGVSVVAPAGNLALSAHHATVTLAPGANRVVLYGDASFAAGGGFSLSLHHVGGARDIGVRIKPPGGEFVTLGESANVVGGAVAYLRYLLTPRGTHERHVRLVGTMTAGTWEVELVADAGPDLDVDAYVYDGQNAWHDGLTFAKPSRERTLCHPATADSAIRVGAYLFQTKTQELYGFSSRGPRIGDAAIGIDLVAPTDALGPVTPSGAETNTYQPFTGTSGAGPHVAGALALLKQAFPSASAKELRDKLLGAARTSADVEADRSGFGRGRLDVLGALGLAAGSGEAPTAHLEIANDGTNAPVATAVLSGAHARARVRWDIGYDGVADTDWEPLGPHTFAGLPPGPLTVVAEIVDDEGFLVRALATVSVGTEAPLVPVAPSPTDGGCAATPRGSRPIGGALLGVAVALTRFARRRRR